MLQDAIDRDAAMINYVTWNDWPEGHHLAPEVNHNFAPSILLRHFKAKWLGQPEPFADLAMLFFKKHPHDIAPENSITIDVKSSRDQPAAEDVIQAVTILTEPARLVLNGLDQGAVSEGLQITDLPRPESDGPLKLVINRNGKKISEVSTPIGITSNPHRLDRMTYSISSRFREEFENIFGTEAEPPISIEP
ncbi:MAG: hypothetical protein ACPGGN_00665 [Opitutales bacterium]